MNGLHGAFRQIWSRIFLRRSQFNSSYGRLKSLYAIEDPWQLQSEKEQTRFLETNKIVENLSLNLDSVLEIGSGEGLQTNHLSRKCRRMFGLEVSELAVSRAKARCPGVDFRIGKAEDAARIYEGEKFDLITAFEVLYYAKDPGKILEDLKLMSPRILVTNYSDRANMMGDLFDGQGWERFPDIVYEDTVWRVDYWEDPSAINRDPIR